MSVPLSESDPPAACEQCGAPLGLEAPGGGCWQCLLSGAAPDTEPRFYQHYRILQRPDGSPWELGRGAMGVTYRAVDVNLETHVALKVIGPGPLADRAGRDRFLHEARAAARIRHPNVASIYHFGTAVLPGGDLGEPECFYAMELVEGDNLQKFARRHGRLEVRLALEIAAQVARGLVAAEREGIVHRDLKPANVMIVAGGEETGPSAGTAWVKVIDFGLAKAIGTKGSISGEQVTGLIPEASTAFLGTPQFASPEQFGGGKVDSRSDTFSLGVTLWHLLTGKLPFDARTAVGIREQHVGGHLPIEQLHAVKVPKPVIELLTSMLAIEPKGRPSTTQALLGDIQRCAASFQARSHSRQRMVGVTIGLLALGGVWACWELLFAKAPPFSGRANDAPLPGSAYDLYRRAQEDLWAGNDAPRKYENSIAKLEKAIAVYPDFARAYAKLAEVHAEIYRQSHDRSPTRAQKVQEAAQAAIRLAPESGEAHRALGIYHYYIRQDYDAAQAEFTKAARSLPNDAETLYLTGLTDRRKHRWLLAAERFTKAAELDSANPEYATHGWQTWARLRRYDRARQMLDAMIIAHPENLQLRMSLAYLSYSEAADVRPMEQTLAQIPPDYDPNGSVTFMRLSFTRYRGDAEAADQILANSSLTHFKGHIDGQIYSRQGMSLLNAVLRGDHEQVKIMAAETRPVALKLIEAAPQSPGPIMWLAMLEATLGNREEALAKGQRALALLPPSSDGVDGPMLGVQMAWVQLLIGNKEAGMDLLEEYAPQPGGLSYGDLRLGVTYAPLRGSARFERLLDRLRAPVR